jgi:predicted phosphate transport protein (TIGR00153 family)
MWGVKKADDKFFDGFRMHAAATARAAKLLQDLFGNLDRAEVLSVEIKNAEHEGDRIVHDTVAALRGTWITPFDRGDIHTLISTLDDVLDLIHAISERVVLFELRAAPPDALAMASDIVEATETIKQAVGLLSDLGRAQEIERLCEKLNKIENDGDQRYRASLARLFNTGIDPLEVMKRREIYENLEMALDRCEDVADAISGVVLEYS